jgi:hypothetical protein
MAAQTESATPSYSMAISPSTIGSAFSTVLTFTISNIGGSSPVTDLAFTDNLPAGVTIATPANLI